MLNTLLIVQIVLAIIIVILVLLQKNTSMGLGIYSGSNQSLFGAKGPAGFLAKATVLVALLFVINTITMGYLYNKRNSASLVDTTKSIVPTLPSQSAKPIAPVAKPASTKAVEGKIDSTKTKPTATKSVESKIDSTKTIPATTKAIQSKADSTKPVMKPAPTTTKGVESKSDSTKQAPAK